jgi:hypothetical protein
MVVRSGNETDEYLVQVFVVSFLSLTVKSSLSVRTSGAIMEVVAVAIFDLPDLDSAEHHAPRGELS